MRINHVLLRTARLSTLDAFLTQVIGVEASERPPFGFPGAWYGMDGRSFIHVVEGPQVNAGPGPVAHVAIEGADLEGLLARLQRQGHPYRMTQVPLSGELQIFIPGPGGLLIEMLFPLTALDQRP